MKKLRKFDERELMMTLKTCRICYVVLSLTVFACWFLSTFDVFKGKESMYLDIILLVDAITYLIAIIIYNPERKQKNEK